MITVAICGCGNRGLFAYASLARLCPEKMKVVAGADIRPERLTMLREMYGVPEEMCFTSDEELLAQPKLADAMIISTQDKQHVEEALKALELGYDSYGDAWPQNVVVSNPTREKLYEALEKGPYGRCVYHCDNDVFDHQTVSMLFKNGVKATFTTSAFTADIYRTIKITGTEGELEGHLEKEKISVRRFGEAERVYDLSEAAEQFGGHSGGDAGLAMNTYNMY